MSTLRTSIAQIEVLMDQNTEASLTYAALECRLAIEWICYERLRVAHDYIAHNDLKKWQPRDIVITLMTEVDSGIAQTFTLFVGAEPLPPGFEPSKAEEYEEMEWIEVGKQIGFDSRKLGKLWNGLANLALHVKLPTKKDDPVSLYGDKKKVRKKVAEALEEIRRISDGTLIATGIGKEISFECRCGVKNRRRIELLNDLQTISCIDPSCIESYTYHRVDGSFERRCFSVTCRKCKAETIIPKKMAENLRSSQNIHFDCEGCKEQITVSWRLMVAQKTEPIGSF